MESESERRQAAAHLAAADRDGAHPKINDGLYRSFYKSGDLPRAMKAYLLYSMWVFSIRDRIPGYSRQYDLGPSIAWDEDEVIVAKEQRTEIHRISRDLLKAHIGERDLVDEVFWPYYEYFWGPMLEAGKMRVQRTAAAKLFYETLPDSVNALIELAWSWADRDNDQEAEPLYVEIIRRVPDYGPALYNLSLIYRRRGLLDQALDMARRAAASDPEEATFERWVSRLEAITAKAKASVTPPKVTVQPSGAEPSRSRPDAEARLRAQAERVKDEAWLRSAPDRWPLLDYYKRRLLGTLSVISSFRGWDDLARQAGQDAKYVPGHWKRLVELGMIIETVDGYRINEYILAHVERERDHQLAIRMIHSNESIIARPVFNSGMEVIVYRVLAEVFPGPGRWVLPNVALSTVFDVARMERRLNDTGSGSTYQFFRYGWVDFLIVSTADFMPLLGLDVDSHYHDQEDQADRDAMKEEIFRVGGIPFLRLRAYGQPSETVIRQQITQEVESLMERLRSEGPKSVTERAFVDDKSFRRRAQNPPEE